VRRTLDAYEAAITANGRRDSRHRIEHIEMIDPADMLRLKELGVIASLQPIAGVGVPGNPPEPILSRVGQEKLPYAYAWQTLRETGAVIAFSSDWPVAPLNPFLGMQAAMTAVPMCEGCEPQAQSLMDTLHGFTAAGAYTEFMEDRKGTLKDGYLADVVVLDADRFGVSQLHQLRGRVGRGGVPGLALFVTDAEPDTVARERVEAVAATTDGFELARIDLELRSEGDVLGARQSGGRSGLRLLRVTRDGDLIAEARDVAAGILGSDPTFAAHPALREAMARRLDESERAFLDKN
jgi:hypothetical protein